MASNTLGPYVKTQQLERFKSKADTIYATKAEVAQTVASAYIFRGSVDTYAELPSQDLSVGDVYNVVAAYGNFPGGTNFAWNGTSWDGLGGSVDLSPLAPKASPAFTGTPTAPTASAGTDTTQIATTAFVQQELSANTVSAGDGLGLANGVMSLKSLVGTANPMIGAADAKLAGLKVVGACAQASTPSMDEPAAIMHTVMTAFVVTKGGTETSVPLSVELYGLSNGTGDSVELDQYGNKTLTRLCGKLTISDFDAVFRVTENHTTFQATPSDAKNFAYGSTAPMYCTHAAIVNQNMDWVPGTVSASHTGTIFLNVDPSITTVSQLAEAYPTLEVIYPLATPVVTSSGAVSMPTVGEGCSISVTHTGADPNSVTPTWWLSAVQALVDGQALQDARISSIESASELNVIETVKVNGTALTPDSSKAVDVTVPTKVSDLNNDTGFITSSSLPTAVSDLTNDTGFITSSSLPTAVSDLTNDTGFITSSDLPEKVSDLRNDSGFQTQAEVETAINTAVAGLYDYKGSVQTYADLPVDADAGDVYNVVTEYQNTPAGTNYAWNGTAWDALGGEIDLSGYAETADLATVATTGEYSDLNGKPTLATVATTGAYSDLSGKPVVDSALSGSSANAVQNQAVKAALDLKAPLASPALTGTPTAPTASVGTDTTQIATTAFVNASVSENAVTSASKHGEGASVLTDGCALIGVTGDGHARQTQTTGKNLAEPNETSGGTVNDITWTYLGGRWKANGTASSTSLYVKAFNLGTLSAGSYTASVRLVNGTCSSFKCRLGKGSDSSYVSDPSNSGEIAVNTFTADGTSQYWIAPSIPSGGAATNAIFEIQLELGSTATSYEPYSGGTPGPNPSYPFPIDVARGRNLLDLGTGLSDWFISNSNGTTIGSTSTSATTKVSGSVDSKTGTVSITSYTTSGWAWIAKLVNLEKNTDYVMHWNTNCAARVLGLSSLADGTAGTSLGGTDSSAHEFTFNSGNYAYWMFSMYPGNNVNAPLTEIQLERGSSPTPYVPYGHVGLEVESKNLAFRQNVVFYMNNLDGTISLNSNGTSFFAHVKPNTEYTVSRTGGNRFIIAQFATRNPANNAAFTAVVSNSNLDQYTFTTSTDTQLVVLYAANSSTADVQCQIELGSTATAYEPYYHTTTPIPIPPSGLGATPSGLKDSLRLASDGTVTCPLNTGETVLDGTGNGYSIRGSSPYGCYWNGVDSTIKRASTNDEVVPILASHLRSTDYNTALYGSSDGNVGVSTVGIIGFKVSNTSITTVSALTTWLSTHPVTVRYPLATPTTWNGGTVTMPPLPKGATVSIPELDAVGVDWIVEDLADLYEVFPTKAEATSSANGLMSSTDKAKLDGIEAEATKNSAGSGLSEESNGALSLGPLVGSGSGSSVLTDGCAIKSVTGTGYARQTQTTGKNLLNVLDTPYEHASSTYEVSQNTVKITAASTNNWAYYSFKVNVSANTAYTMSFDTSNPSNCLLSYEYYNSSGTRISGSNSAEMVRTVTTPEGTAYIVISFFARKTASGNVGDTCTYFNPQLESGSTATSYEPYTGGIPGPNPSYPQEIRVARGRNLFDKTNRSLIVSGKYYDTQGQIGTESTWSIAYVPCKAGETYTVSGYKGYGTVGVCTAASVGASTATYSSDGYRNSSYTKNTVVAAFDGYLAVPFYSSSTGANGSEIDTLQVERGTTPSPYVPYGHVGLEIGVPMTELSWENNSMSIAVGSSYAAAKGGSTSIRLRAVTPFPFETSKLVFGVATGYSLNAIACKNGVMVAYANANGSISVLDMANADSVAFYMQRTDNGNVNSQSVADSGMFAVSVVPLPIPSTGLAALTGATDALRLDVTGHETCVMGTGEVVYTGEETWSVSTADSNSVAYAPSPSDSPTNKGNGHPSLCSHYIYRGSDFNYNNRFMLNSTAMSGATKYIAVIDNAHATSVANFKTWLASNPITIRYPLSTPKTLDMGYVTLPKLKPGMTLSIPELDSIGVEWYVEGMGEVLDTIDGKNALTRSGTRNPITAVDGTGIYSVEATGFAKQDTTTGKNLLPALLSVTKTENTLGTWSGNVYTVNGLTLAFDVDGDSIKSITVSGTASALTFITVGTRNTTYAAGSYTVSGCASGGGEAKHLVRLYNNSNDGVHATDEGHGKSFTTAEAISARLQIRIANGYQISSPLVFYPQIESGSVATSYEPYTGGIASPNPSYPQEIKVARGRNLLKLPTYAELTTSPQSSGYYNYPIQLEPNTTYYLSTGYKPGGNSKYGGYVLLANNTTSGYGTDYQRIAHASSGNNSASISTGSDGKLYLNVVATQAQYEHVLQYAEAQLELGSTPSPYVPYGHVGLEARPNITLYKSGYTISESGVENQNSDVKILSCGIRGGSYEITLTSNNNFNCRLHGYDENGNWIKQIAVVFGSGTETITVPDGIPELRASLSINGNMSLLNVTPLPIPSSGLAALTDAEDTLVLDSAGHVGGSKKTTWYTITGNETMQEPSSQDRGDCYRIVLLGPLENSSGTDNFVGAYSTKFIANPSWEEDVNHFYIDGRTGYNNLVLFVHGANSSSEALAMAIGTKFLYPLATPQTWDGGYVNLPPIAPGMTLSIPELEEAGVKWTWWVDGADEIAQHSENLRKRWESSVESANADILDHIGWNSSGMWLEMVTNGTRYRLWLNANGTSPELRLEYQEVSDWIDSWVTAWSSEL